MRKYHSSEMAPVINVLHERRIGLDGLVTCWNDRVYLCDIVLEMCFWAMKNFVECVFF